MSERDSGEFPTNEWNNQTWEGPHSTPEDGAGPLALAAIVCGIVAVVLSLVPFANLTLSFLPAMAAIVLGIVCLAAKKPNLPRHRKQSIGGIILGAVALVMSFVVTAGTLIVLEARSPDRPKLVGKRVVLEVESVTGTPADIKWYAGPRSGSAPSAPERWSKTFTLRSSDNYAAVDAIGTGQLRCRITVNGVVYDEVVGSQSVTCQAYVNRPPQEGWGDSYEDDPSLQGTSVSLHHSLERSTR